MKIPLTILAVLLRNLYADATANENTANCDASTGPKPQMPGAEGPVADDGRASSGHLAWIGGRSLHTPSSVIGKIAAETGASKLVLSHFMARSLENMRENLQQVQSRYKGVMVSVNELGCVGLKL